MNTRGNTLLRRDAEKSCAGGPRQAVFSPRQSRKHLLCGTSAFGLEAPADSEVVVLSPQQFTTIEEPARAGHGHVLEVQVHPHHAAAVAFLHFFLDDDVEAEGVLVVAVVECPHPFLVLVVIEIRPLVLSEDEINSDPPVHGGESGRPVLDGQRSLVVHRRRFIESGERSAVALLPVCDSGFHRLHRLGIRPNAEVGREVCLVSQIVVHAVVYFRLAEDEIPVVVASVSTV